MTKRHLKVKVLVWVSVSPETTQNRRKILVEMKTFHATCLCWMFSLTRRMIVAMRRSFVLFCVNPCNIDICFGNLLLSRRNHVALEWSAETIKNGAGVARNFRFEKSADGLMQHISWNSPNDLNYQNSVKSRSRILKHIHWLRKRILHQTQNEFSGHVITFASDHCLLSVNIQ